MRGFKINLIGDLAVVKEARLFELGVSQSALKEAKANMLIPHDFDRERNTDILPVVFSLAVVNQFNLNDDGMDTETALDALQHFKNKPINIEHKKDQIVGHIINASLSEKEPDFKMGENEDFIGKKTPFYITAAGLIYAKIFPDLANFLIDANDPASSNYKSISASWEIAFGSFEVVKSKNHYLMNGSVLGEEEKESNISNLRAFGGTGVDKDGNNVYRLIQKPALPLGAALTFSPAANVKGVFVSENFADFGSKKEGEKDIDNNKISHLNKKHVREGKSHIMDEKQFAEFLKTVKDTLAATSVSEANQGSMISKITEALDKRSKEWEKEQTDSVAAKAKLTSDLEAAQKELALAKETSEKTVAELEKIKTQVAAQAKASLLQNRMKAVESKFELSTEESEIIANELTKVEEKEEDFASYVKKLDVIFAHKNREMIAKAKAERDKEEDKKEGDDKELETEGADKNRVPNSNKGQADKEDLLTRLKKSFEVSYSGQKTKN